MVNRVTLLFEEVTNYLAFIKGRSQKSGVQIPTYNCGSLIGDWLSPTLCFI
jgi:hypothetical protein